MRRFTSLRPKKGWREEEVLVSPPAFYASTDMPPPRAPPTHHSTTTTKKKRHATLSRLERSQTLSTLSVPSLGRESDDEHATLPTLAAATEEGGRRHTGALASSLPTRKAGNKEKSSTAAKRPSNGFFHSVSVRSIGGSSGGCGSDSSLSSNSSLSSSASISSSTALWEDAPGDGDAVTHGAAVIARLVRLKTVPFQEWSVKDVCMWLDLLCMGMYIPAFRRNEVTGQYLTQIDKHDLRSMGMKSIGHRKRFERRLKMLVDRDEGALDEPSLTERRGAKNSSALWSMSYQQSQQQHHHHQHQPHTSSLKIPSFSISSFSIGGASKKEREEKAKQKQKQHSNNSSVSSRGSVDDSAVGLLSSEGQATATPKHGTIDSLIETLTSTTNQADAKQVMEKVVGPKDANAATAGVKNGTARQERRGSVSLMIERWELLGTSSGTVPTKLTRTTSDDQPDPLSSRATALDDRQPLSPKSLTKRKSPRAFIHYFSLSRSYRPHAALTTDSAAPGHRPAAAKHGESESNVGGKKPKPNVGGGGAGAEPPVVPMLVISPAVRALQKEAQRRRRLSIPVTPREKQGTQILLRLNEEREAAERRQILEQQQQQQEQPPAAPVTPKSARTEGESTEAKSSGESHEASPIDTPTAGAKKTVEVEVKAEEQMERVESGAVEAEIMKSPLKKKEKVESGAVEAEMERVESGAVEAEIMTSPLKKKEKEPKKEKTSRKPHKKEAKKNEDEGTPTLRKARSKSLKRSTAKALASSMDSAASPPPDAAIEPIEKSEAAIAEKPKERRTKGRSKSLGKGSGKEIKRELVTGTTKEDKEAKEAKKGKRRTAGLLNDWRKNLKTGEDGGDDAVATTIVAKSPVVRKVRRRETLGSLADGQRLTAGKEEKSEDGGEKVRAKKAKKTGFDATIHASLDHQAIGAMCGDEEEESPKRKKKKRSKSLSRSDGKEMMKKKELLIGTKTVDPMEKLKRAKERHHSAEDLIQEHHSAKRKKKRKSIEQKHGTTSSSTDHSEPTTTVTTATTDDAKQEKKKKKKATKASSPSSSSSSSSSSSAASASTPTAKSKKQHGKEKGKERDKGARLRKSGQNTPDKREAAKVREKAEDEMDAWWWRKRADRVMIKCFWGDELTIVFVRPDIRLPQLKRLLRKQFLQPPHWRIELKSHYNLQRRLVTLNKTAYLHAALQYHVRTSYDPKHPMERAAMRLFLREVS
ncbi:SAM domain (Sterile alpha motif) domain containing protein [Acanthamoeba castellanii str. Neff]|uniref:SAM domain (Sterile alpha motif) domain containing protein n=1 Tax=Acanthamoeba castellanii (strain ATCC 30010 / Neff) TaxID=1257118 RepID=L8GK75_ACACF|nr:SAM domain (Sterile alpha motif) domain containing protein [Acanthamoeba castellanii str. Neff]ELR13103.1 SAM domain (Sterile alpha motif) domain containing protein [Acanthamoeba castellanii str. Neff]